LFVDFKGYIQFFLLHDFVNENYLVKYFIPFDNFIRSAFPHNLEEYIQYRAETIEAINGRNQRILKWLSNSFTQ